MSSLPHCDHPSSKQKGKNYWSITLTTKLLSEPLLAVRRRLESAYRVKNSSVNFEFSVSEKLILIKTYQTPAHSVVFFEVFGHLVNV